jgi:hypothetical protein
VVPGQKPQVTASLPEPTTLPAQVGQVGNWVQGSLREVEGSGLDCRRYFFLQKAVVYAQSGSNPCSQSAHGTNGAVAFRIRHILISVCFLQIGETE